MTALPHSTVEGWVPVLAAGEGRGAGDVRVRPDVSVLVRPDVSGVRCPVFGVRVTGRSMRGAVVVVAKVKHPTSSRLTAKVTCSSFMHTSEAKAGRVVARMKKSGAPVRVRSVALPTGLARVAYAGHVWTRTWWVAR